MTYQQTLDYLYEQLPMFQRIGAAAFKKDLSNTLALVEHLHQPHRAYPCVHIAGTNGKGSTTHIIAAVLQAIGLKVGVYTSPHYRDFRERIKINGNLVPESYVADFVAQHRETFDRIRPSFFEITVAMAFDYFRSEAVEVAVIETGLGGRLDSTNIIRPLLSVITNISLDHQQLLGDTLPLIAAEKAGIIKPHIPVVIGEHAAETDHVFRHKATAEAAPIFFAEEMVSVQPIATGIGKSTYALRTDLFGGLQTTFVSDLWGNYQHKNLQTALASLSMLQPHFPVTAEPLLNALRTVKAATRMMGRWEILSKEPLVLADSGHNEAGIRLMTAQLEQFNYKQLHIVLGMVKDKDVRKILRWLPPHATYYFACPNIPRGLDAPILLQYAAEVGLKGKPFDSVQAALAAAKACASSEDLIFVGGSTFVVAEVM